MNDIPKDFPILEQIGLNLYDRRALIALLGKGISDAASLCGQGDIPTSKIYKSMEKLAALGLVDIQPTRPRLFAALSIEDVVARAGVIASENASGFAKAVEDLIPLVKDASGGASGRTFADLALGVENHARRHLIHLAGAKTQIVSYMEAADLAVFRASAKDGFPILKRIARNVAERGVSHRAVFGFSNASAPDLIAFLKEFHGEVEAMTGVRFAGELGQPFHVVDGEIVILCLDNAFLPERRFASLMMRSADLARGLTEGFEGLWAKAMRSLREIDVHPGFGAR